MVGKHLILLSIVAMSSLFSAVVMATITDWVVVRVAIHSLMVIATLSFLVLEILVFWVVRKIDEI